MSIWWRRGKPVFVFIMVLIQQIVKEQKQKEEVNGKADQSGEEKVPVLTISLRPGKLKFVRLCVCIPVCLAKSWMYHLFHNSSDAWDIKPCFAKARVLDIQWEGKLIRTIRQKTAAGIPLSHRNSEHLLVCCHFDVGYCDSSLSSVAGANGRVWKQRRRPGECAEWTRRRKETGLQEEEDTCGNRKRQRHGHGQYASLQHFWPTCFLICQKRYSYSQLLKFDKIFKFIHQRNFTSMSVSRENVFFFLFPPNRHPVREEAEDHNESWGEEPQLGSSTIGW